jgi:hypothetical protein
MINNIFEAIEKNHFSYEEIKEKSYISLINNSEFDVNVIIGFRSRKEFLIPIIESFKKSFSYYNNKFIIPKESKSFCLTFVEHSKISECKSQLEGIVNYLWTPGNIIEQYNRSFAYNFGVKYSNKAKYYLLHDVDILVKENFFEELFKNLNNSKCIQPYGKRRVLYLSEELTKKVINKKININTLEEKTPGIKLPMYAGQPALGSKGGSIFVERNLYYEVGGFDSQIFFGYAAEDQMFWDKIITVVGEINYSDNPSIDIFHMWHPPTNMTNPLMYEMENYMIQFRGMTKKERFKLLNIQKENFSHKPIIV